jgi:hypothetical protein
MRFDVLRDDRNAGRQRMNHFSCRKEEGSGVGRRRRQCRHQHQAADTATIGAGFIVGLVAGGCGLPADGVMANNAA